MIQQGIVFEGNESKDVISTISKQYIEMDFDDIVFNSQYKFRDKIDTKFLETLTNSIELLEMQDPISIDCNNVVFDGHYRYLVAKKKKVKTIGVWKYNVSGDIIYLIAFEKNIRKNYTPFERGRLFKKTKDIYERIITEARKGAYMSRYRKNSATLLLSKQELEEKGIISINNNKIDSAVEYISRRSGYSKRTVEKSILVDERIEQGEIPADIARKYKMNMISQSKVEAEIQEQKEKREAEEQREREENRKKEEKNALVKKTRNVNLEIIKSNPKSREQFCWNCRIPGKIITKCPCCEENLIMCPIKIEVESENTREQSRSASNDEILLSVMSKACNFYRI